MFWSGEHLRNQAHIQVSPSTSGRYCNTYKQAVQSCRITHYTGADGHEQILVKRQGQVVQMRCSGLSLLSSTPVQTNFLIPQTGTLKDSFRTVQNASQIFRQDLSPLPWTRTTLVLRNALIAHDCMVSGRSIRETAIMTYGWERTMAEWSGPGRALKDQIRRSRRKAKDLVNGGYLDLLKMLPPAGGL